MPARRLFKTVILAHASWSRLSLALLSVCGGRVGGDPAAAIALPNDGSSGGGDSSLSGMDATGNEESSSSGSGSSGGSGSTSSSTSSIGDAGACATGRTQCGGACVDEQTDPNNCGGCGLACSGACSSGECVVVVKLATVLDAWGIAVDAMSVYWTNGPCNVPRYVPTATPQCTGDSHTVMKVPVGGGTATQLVSRGSGHSIAVDSTSVYWTEGLSGSCSGSYCTSGGRPDLVMKASLDGGNVTTLASGQNASGIAVDATSVYWVNGSTNAPNGAVANDGTVMKVPLSGGAVTTLASGQNPSGIAVDAANVYWINSVTAASDTNGTVMKVALDGGAVTMLASGQNPIRIAVDATSVYWTNYTSASGTVMKVPLNGGTVTTLASGQAYPAGIAVDATSVYWTASGTSVMKVPLGGGTATSLSSAMNGTGNIAVGATSVYWTNNWHGGWGAGGFGEVMKATPK